MRSIAKIRFAVAALFGALILAVSASAAPVFDHDFGSFSNPRSITVDQQTGDVYVVDTGSNSIQKFDADGNPANFSALGSNVLDGAGAGETDETPQGGFLFSSFNSPDAPQLAIDESGGVNDGTLYVTSLSLGGSSGEAAAIHIFSPSGTYLGQITGSAIPFFTSFSTPCGVAVDPDGSVYVADPGFRSIQKFTPSGGVLADGDWKERLEPFASQGDFCNLAIDANDHLYSSSLPSGPLTRYDLSQFSSDPQSRPVEGVEIDALATAVAIDRSTGDIYSDHGNAIAQYDESGLLLGTFAESDLSDSHGVAINSSTGDLYATNSPSATAKLFVAPPPAPPTIDAQRTEQVHSTAAKLLANVGPEGHATTYHAEYGTAGPCSVPASACASTPERSAGLGFAPVTASAQASGLSPDTTYHYRIVAENAHGTAAGPDYTFRTYPAASGFTLPEGRAYELVSPADTNGFPVAPMRVQSASPSGDRIAFQATRGAAPGTASGVAGDPLRATRSASGWATKSLIPEESVASTSFGDVPYVRAFDEDLRTYIFEAPLQLTPDAPLIEPPFFGAHAKNLYLRDSSESDHVLNPLLPLLTGPDTSYQISTPDLRHVVFSSFRPQLDDPNIVDFQNYLYEWDEGDLRVASVLPDGTLQSGVFVGGSQSNLGFQHPISEDGARFFFHAGPDSRLGQIFVRENGSSTTHVSASQRTVPDPNGPLPALFLAAEAAHGGKALLSSCEKLTDDSTASSDPADPTGGDCQLNSVGKSAADKSDLYLYDVDSEQLSDLTIADPSGGDFTGLIGASDDLSRIYFAARGVLAPGAAPGQINTYLWDNGTTSFIWAPPPEAYIGDAVQDFHNWFPDARELARASRVSTSGRYLLFTSRADLTAYDNSGPGCPLDEDVVGPSIGRQCSEVYRYDAVTDELKCLSCPASGIRSTGDSQLLTIGDFFNGGISSPPPNNLLEDGTAYFETPNRLVAEDTNTEVDVYQYRDGGLRLISNGAQTGGGRFAEATPDGSNVFFTTPARLVSSDFGDSVDLYDARVGGGFPGPVALPDCEGDACAPLPVAPNDPTPASSSYLGSGSPSARANARCAKGKVRREGRCAKKKKSSKRANHNQRTNHSRRASR